MNESNFSQIMERFWIDVSGNQFVVNFLLGQHIRSDIYPLKRVTKYNSSGMKKMYKCTSELKIS